MESISLTIDGMTVEITVERSSDGPVLVLGGVDCDLEGVCPGEYLLLAHVAAS